MAIEAISEHLRILNLQAVCLEYAPQEGTYRFLLEALVCAKDLPRGSNLRELFLTTQLYHLVVISFSQVQLIKDILTRYFSASAQQVLFVLSLFCAWTGFQPPVLRALFEIFNLELKLKYKIAIPWPVTPLLLCLNPDWITSLSFFLSCFLSLIAGLLTLLQPKAGASENFLLSLVIFQLVVCVLFQTNSPAGFFFNLVFTPILSFVLWPLAQLSYLVSHTDFFDFFTGSLASLLASLAAGLPKANTTWNHSWLILWTAFLSCEVFTYYLQRKQLVQK